MDREEYRLRTDEIKNLVRDKQYPEAVRIADSIDWKRVKSLKMLGMIGYLYKVSGDLEKSRNAMLLAYDRDPSNPEIVYSLCELSIKLGDLIGSVEYMKEYARLAPGNPGIYILRYKLYEEQGVSLDERAELLEEYQSIEFKPKWAYELASLYHGIGDEPRLVGECDAVFDHFAGDMKPSSHRYVLKTLELKELHTPLSPAQQSYLDSARAAEQARLEAEEAERRRLEEEARAREAAQLAAEEERERWVAEKRAARSAGAKTGKMRTDTTRMPRMQDAPGQGEVPSDTVMYAPVQQMTAPIRQASIQQAALQQTATQAQDALDGRTAVFNPVRAEEYAQSDLVDSPTRVLPPVQGYARDQQIPAANQPPSGSTPAYVPVMHPYDSDHLQQELAKNIQDVMPDSGYEPEVFTGYHPNPYEKPKAQPAKPQSGHRGAIRHKQRRYDNMLSQEGDGQISLVLPEDEVIERQITGQISIDDIMERIRNYSKEAQEARVEQIVRGRTDGMFNSFERQAKEGPQVELDKMLGLDRVTARDVARQQDNKKVSLISRPAVAAVIRPEVPAETVLTPDNPNVVTPEKAESAETDEMKQVTVDSAEERTGTEAEALQELESAKQARAETTNLNLNMGTAESASALETAKAGMRSEKSATAIETADSSSNSEEAATALETNETTSDSAKAAMALTNIAASEVTSGAAASTAGTIAGAGVMTVGAQIAVKSTGIPAYLLSGEAALKQKENDHAQQAENETANPGQKEEMSAEQLSTESAETSKIEVKDTGIPAYMLSAEVRPEKKEEAEDAEEEIDAAADAQLEPTEDDDESQSADTSDDRADVTEEEITEAGDVSDEETKDEVETEDEYESETVTEGVRQTESDEAGESAKKTTLAEKKDIVDEESESDSSDMQKTGEEESVTDPDSSETEDVDAEVNQSDAAVDMVANGTDDHAEQATDAATIPLNQSEASDQIQKEETKSDHTSEESEDAVTEQAQATEEESHTPSETSNVSSDTAEFEAIRVENQEEVRKLSDEELSARVENMSEAEREQYGHILHNHKILRQILVAADELSERAKFGVVVLGKDNGLTLDIAKGLVRSSTKEYKTFTGRAAKIKGADLKAHKVPDFFKQLHNGALIITGAGRINKDASEALSRAMHENARFTMVILTDTDKHIRDLMNREPSLEELFKVKVDTEIAGGDDSLVAYGKEYAREREYSIDNLGTLALHSRIEEMQTFEHKVTTEDVKAIVDEAIENSSKRKFSHFVDVLSHKRYDDEDMIILREKDFLHQ